MPLRRPAPFASLVAATVLVLSGCSMIPGVSGGSDASDGGSASATSTAGGTPIADGALPEIGTSTAADLPGDPATEPTYASYYGQAIAWAPCDDHPAAQCGTVRVPLAWDDPSQGDITLPLLKIPATGTSQGSLLMNPGGPGGSGVSFVGEGGTSIVSETIRESYDLIGFDPRGVAGSDPAVACLDDQQTDEYLAATHDMLTSDGLADAEDWMSRVADACAQNSGDLLGHVDTLSAARDLDVMRAAVGSEKLDYLGFSYGTYLGSTYADLYPSRVGHMVLDGAIDPSITGDEMSAGQAEGFEVATEHFAQWCIDQGPETCPLKGDGAQGAQQIRDFFAATDQQPVDSGDPARPLTGSLARSGVLVGLYNDANWSYVAQALGGAMNGDGRLLLQLADLSSERGADGHYEGNGNFAITAVNCLDHPAVEDEAWQAAEAKRLAEEYPTFGPGLGYNGSACAAWPAGPVRKPAEIHAKGSGPILVIGTRYDPATPYAWAQALAEQLDEGHLITWNGEGHTAYGRSGGCIEDAVDQYILAGTLPADGLTCD